MRSLQAVMEDIGKIRESGIPLSEAAWKAAQLCIGWPYIFGDRGVRCTPGHREAVYQAHQDQKGLISKCQALNGCAEDCKGCKWYPDGQRVAAYDCRGFTYWILLQIYGWKLMGAGCTSQWDDEDNWKAKGEVADGIPQGVIVCLFYYKKDKAGQRTKTLEHTGLYYNGETIECSNGVQHSATLAKKWEVWGVPACVEGDTPQPEPQPEPEKKPTLRQGDRGEAVREMQNALISLGYHVGQTGADGIFGKNTRSGVAAFQASAGIRVDGICGPETWAAIAAAIRPEPDKPVMYTVHIPHAAEDEANRILDQYPGSWVTVE